MVYWYWFGSVAKAVYKDYTGKLLGERGSEANTGGRYRPDLDSHSTFTLSRYQQLVAKALSKVSPFHDGAFIEVAKEKRHLVQNPLVQKCVAGVILVMVFLCHVRTRLN